MAPVPEPEYREKATPATFSCRPSFRCIQAEFWGFQDRIIFNHGATGGDAFCHGSDSLAEETRGAKEDERKERVSTPRGMW